MICGVRLDYSVIRLTMEIIDMKAIILGIYDYLKDWWHDLPLYYPDSKWKEGNIWHYIRQRRIAAMVKKERKTK